MKKVLLSLAMLSVISTPVLAKAPVANLKTNCLLVATKG